jgi:NTP pyrophosphatase (non-canonical NTP hydrolase)
MTFVEIEKKVILWGETRDLYKQSTVQSQYYKLLEECVELKFSLSHKNTADSVDAIGDIMVVLTHIAHMLDLDLSTCYLLAYEEIKDRKGKMVNDLFVKEG